MRGRIIEEPKCLFICFLGGFGLLVRDGTVGNENYWFDGKAVVQQGSKNMLDQGDGFGGYQRGDVVIGSILYIGAICWTITRVRRVLGDLGRRVLEVLEGLF